jgi:hypothetical protein
LEHFRRELRISTAHEQFTANPAIADIYFSNFTVIWRNSLDDGNFAYAEHIWERIRNRIT